MERWGNCLGCGESSKDPFCYTCEKKADSAKPEPELHYCIQCQDELVDKEGDIGANCKEIHEDGDCDSYCMTCDQLRDMAEASRDEEADYRYRMKIEG